MNKKRHHLTTKNTVAKTPITRLAEYTLDVNGTFTIVTNITDSNIFDKVYREWFDHPLTNMWCGESLVAYIKEKFPDKICLLKDDYAKIIEGKGVVSATKEEWEAENN